MTATTFHAVQTFEMIHTRSGFGLKAGRPLQCKSEDAAIARAKMLAETATGVIAFTQTGDADLGDFAEPLILFSGGKVPEEMFG